MTVQQLREMVISLQPVFDSAGAAKTARELGEFAAGLGDFNGQMTLAAFFKLAKDGQKPPPPPKVPPPPKTPKPSVEDIIREVAGVHERPRDPTVTNDVITGTLAKLKPLTKPDLGRVASAVGLTATAKQTKDGVIDAIRKRIDERRDAALKNDLIGGGEQASPERRPVPVTAPTAPV